MVSQLIHEQNTLFLRYLPGKTRYKIKKFKKVS